MKTYRKLKKFDNPILNSVLLQNLTPIQEKYLLDQHRFTLNPSGRRSRKTLLGMYKAFIWALKETGTYLFAAPVQDQAYEIFFDRLLAITKFLNIYVDHKLSPKPKIWIENLNGELSLLKIIGLDVPARAEGSEVRFLHATEVPDISDNTWWDEHIRPMFSDETTVGTRRAIFDGTYDYRKPYWADMIQEHCGGAVDNPEHNKPVCIEDPNDDDWITYIWVSEDVLPPKEITKLRNSYEDKLYLQEFCGQIITNAGRVYYGYTEKNNTDITFDVSRETYLSFDFNVSPFTCTVWQKVDIDEIQCKACVHEFAFYDSNANDATPRIINWLKEQGFNPQHRQLFLTGDHAGNSRNHAVSYSAWNIIVNIFNDAGISATKYTRHTKPGELKDGQDSLNSRFAPYVGKPIYYVNKEKCPKLHKDLMTLKLLENGQQNDESGKFGHLCDTARYLCYNYDRIIIPSIITTGLS